MVKVLTHKTKTGGLMAVPIQPLADYVVVQPEEAEAKTASGLYIPDNAKEKPKIAKVLAVGPGKVGDDNERIPVSVKVGDRVVYGGYSNTSIKIGAKEYMIIKEEDILATVK
jgi:chaperonin GroES